MTGEPPPSATPAAAKVPIWKKKVFQIGALAAVLVVGAGGYIAFTKFLAPPPPPPVVPKPKPASLGSAKPPSAPSSATVPAATAPLPALANKPAVPAPALSETQSAIAHAPVNAINKARDVVAKREASGQSRDAVGAITGADEPADRSAVKSGPAAKPAASASTGTSTTIAPGISATNDNVVAAAEASPAFRSFVANAKITGVFQGDPPRVYINGRLARAGDNVEPSLGITFDSVDPEKKLIIFKDKGGSTVTRRY